MIAKLPYDSDDVKAGDDVKAVGERSAGKPHAAFDEGGLGKPCPLLYCSLWLIFKSGLSGWGGYSLIA